MTMRTFVESSDSLGAILVRLPLLCSSYSSLSYTDGPNLGHSLVSGSGQPIHLCVLR
jgi:hypothetical protein